MCLYNPPLYQLSYPKWDTSSSDVASATELPEGNNTQKKCVEWDLNPRGFLQEILSLPP